MTTVYRFAAAELHPAQRRLLVDGEDSRVGARAFDLLLALLERRDRVVSKHELLDAVWPGVVVEENNLQVQISSLRKLLGPQAIATVPGRGYRFTAALEGPAAAPVPELAPHPASVPGGRAPPGNLPAQPARLFGRERDLDAVRTLIESHRLVSLVGAGGIGKTALAQALAQQLQPTFEDGAWLVELASLADASQVAGAVASTLQIALGAEAPTAALARGLGARRMLIVLDNCEHLLQGVAEVAAALYRAAPHVRLLATSQEPLRIAREQLHRLDALALPADDRLERAREAGAVALFEARAQEADPRFVLGPDNVVPVIEICRRLDGIALAIELAAARVPLLGVDGLRARLGERFRVLTGGSRVALRRHQTLRAALDWSYGLLMPPEQAMLRRLGVFASSFGLAAALRVAAEPGEDEWTALDRLGALVDKSLVVVEAEAGAAEAPRYRLLETTRAFALEKLHDSGETEDALRGHAEATLAIFEASDADAATLPTHRRLARYLPDLDNARVALDWAAGEGGDAELHVALAGAMAWIWARAGLRLEGMRRTERALAAVGAATPPHLEARLQSAWLSVALPLTGAREAAAEARALALYRQLGDQRRLYTLLCERCMAQCLCHDLDEAERALAEAEALWQADWPPAMRAAGLNARGWLCSAKGRHEDSLTAYAELIRLARALGDKLLEVTALINQEQAVAMLGRWQESAALGSELVRRLQEEHFPGGGGIETAMLNLCIALTQSGALDEALDVARRVRPLLGKTGALSEALDPFALLAFERGDPACAARIVGRADARYSGGALKRHSVEQALRDALMQVLRRTLPAETLQRLLREGEALTDEEAVALVLGT